MNNNIGELHSKLQQIADRVNAMSGGDLVTPLTDRFGWNVPSVTSMDLVNLPLEIIKNTQSIIDTDNSELNEIIPGLLQKLFSLENNIINNNYIFNGNAAQAVSAYLDSLNRIKDQLIPFVNWQIIENPKSMPVNIAKRIRKINFEVDQLIPDQESLKSKIDSIEKAHEVAENLPVDLLSLAELKKHLAATSEDATLKKTKIQGILDSSNNAHDKLKTIQTEAEKILVGCEDTYRASTSRGLAIAFDQRAANLKLSVRLWTALLVCSLIAIATVGYLRAEQLNNILNSTNPINWGLISLSTVFSILGVVAPGWLAWLSTKQISQRFRLSEDYEFKASVAKAYEGYRSEAVKMDIKFTSRLFDSALSRLDEHPLRLIEADYHGSPLHELLNSAAFKKAADIVPELKDKALEIAKSAADKIPNIDSKVDNP